MELFFLLLLIVIMATALGSGYPVAFALPGLGDHHRAAGRGRGIHLRQAAPTPISPSGGPSQWLSAGVTNLRGVYWEPERDTLIAIPLFIFMGIMLQRSKIAEDLLVTMAQLFGPVPGGLGISVVVVGRAAGSDHRHRRRDRGRDGPDLAARDDAQRLCQPAVLGHHRGQPARSGRSFRRR